jgi:ABC-type ATPase involved in cell division
MLEKLAAVFDYVIKDESEPSIPEFLLERCQSNFKLAYIVGDSGSGKTTMIKNLHKNYGWNILDSISEIVKKCTIVNQDIHGVNIKSSNIDNLTKIDTPLASFFPTTEEAIERLCMAGLCSVPTWFRPYHMISAGEQFRASIALGLTNKTIIDEFTSNLDRLTARSLASALNKYICKNRFQNIICAGCQYDIIQWLNPDFIYDLNIKDFILLHVTLPRWKLLVQFNLDEVTIASKNIDDKVLVLRCSTRDRWKHYAQHHYLSETVLNNARCWEAFVLIENVERSIAFIAICTMPSSATIKLSVREHRLVVLPCLQGTGVGIVISETLADRYCNEGYRYFSKTTHPRLGMYRDKSPFWRATGSNHKISNPSANSKWFWKKTARLCYAHEYIKVNNIQTEVTLDKCNEINSNIGTSHFKIISDQVQGQEQAQLQFQAQTYVQTELQLVSQVQAQVASQVQAQVVSQVQAQVVSQVQALGKTDVHGFQISKELTVEKIYPHLVWLPLKIFGTMKIKGSGDVVVRMSHKYTFFSINKSNTPFSTTEEAKNAAKYFLIQESKYKPNNLYARVNDTTIYVDLSKNYLGTELLVINSDMLDLLGTTVWRTRNKRVITHGPNYRIYLEEVLYPGYSVLCHKNDNWLDFRSTNVELRKNI